MQKKGLFIIIVLLFSLISIEYAFSLDYCSSNLDCYGGQDYNCVDYLGSKICQYEISVSGSCQESGGQPFTCTNDKTRCVASGFYPPKYKVCATGKYCNLISGLGSCVDKKTSGSTCSKDTECISNKCSVGICLTEGGGSCTSLNNCASGDCYQGKCRSENYWIGDCPNNGVCSSINYNACLGSVWRYCGAGYICEMSGGKGSCVVQGSGIDWSKVGDVVSGEDDNIQTTDVVLITEGTTEPGSSGDLCNNNNPCLIGHECYNGKCAYVNQPIPQYGWIGYGGCGDDYNLCKTDGTGCVSDSGNSIKKCLASHYCYDNFGVGVSCDLKKQSEASCGNNFECQNGKCEGFVCSSGPQVQCLDNNECQPNGQCVNGECVFPGPIADQSTDTIALDANNWVGLCRISNYAPDNAKGWKCNNNLDKCVSNSGEIRKCASTHYCKNGANDFFDKCEEKFNVGQTCSGSYQCKSGKCENNKCASIYEVTDIDVPGTDINDLDFFSDIILASDGSICAEDNNCASNNCYKFGASDLITFGVCRSKNYWVGGCPAVYSGSLTCGCTSDGACKGPGGWLGLCSSETDKVYTCGAGYHCDPNLKACVGNVDLKEDGESCESSSECNSGDCYNVGGSLDKICRGEGFWIGDCPSSTSLCLDDGDTSNCIAGFGRNGPVIIKTCAPGYYCKGVSNDLFSCSSKKPSGTDCRIGGECLSGICFNNKCSVDQVTTDCGIGYTCSEDGIICVPLNQNNPVVLCGSNNYCTSIGSSSSGSESVELSFLDIQLPNVIESSATCNNIKKGDGVVCSENYECSSGSCVSGFCGGQVAPCDNDGVCDPGETFFNCASDCPQSLCGNNFCDSTETTINCELDCPPVPSAVCGNNLCETGELSTCSQDCQSCITDTNCDSGEECVSSFCQQISCSANNLCVQGQTCNNGVCQVTECSATNLCFAGQVCNSNSVCETADICTNNACPSGQTCSSNICIQNTCTNNIQCSSGSYCGDNSFCQPIPKSCSSADGIVCKSPAICDNNSKPYADSIELGCCVPKATGNPGCTSAPIYISTLGSSVKFEKACVNGQTQITVKDANDQKINDNDNQYSKLGITSNPYIDYNDYSCNTGLIGDTAQPVYGYGLLSLFLSLGIIGIYYILRKKKY